MQRLLRPIAYHHSAVPLWTCRHVRSGSPPSGGSTLMTSAPKYAEQHRRERAGDQLPEFEDAQALEVVACDTVPIAKRLANQAFTASAISVYYQPPYGCRPRASTSPPPWTCRKWTTPSTRPRRRSGQRYDFKGAHIEIDFDKAKSTDLRCLPMTTTSCRPCGRCCRARCSSATSRSRTSSWATRRWPPAVPVPSRWCRCSRAFPPRPPRPS